MPIYLDEDMVGADQAKICFPHLLLCMGVVLVMDDGSLIGAHFSGSSSEQAVLRAMRFAMDRQGGNAVQVYGMGHLAEHLRFGNMDIKGKAHALAFRGTAWFADMAFMNPTNGSYAEVTSNGADQQATVRCKLDEHMNYRRKESPGTAKPTVLKGIAPRDKVDRSGSGFQVQRVVTSEVMTFGAAIAPGEDLRTPVLKKIRVR